MATMVTPAANPLADLLGEPAFLDAVVRAATPVSLSDLPSVLAEFQGQETRTDPSEVVRLIEFTAAMAKRYPKLAARSTFLVAPEDLWRRAESDLPVFDRPVPANLIWVEAGCHARQAVVVPNTRGNGPAVMLFRLGRPSPAATRLVPVQFPFQPEAKPGEVRTDCEMDWVVDGEWARLECAGQCVAGSCAASRYHVKGGPEVCPGCYCG